jgi:hypothetical protein
MPPAGPVHGHTAVPEEATVMRNPSLPHQSAGRPNPDTPGAAPFATAAQADRFRVARTDLVAGTTRSLLRSRRPSSAKWAQPAHP